ncbi:MAG: hypothetical protein V2J12_07625 [Gammaproteobacteria bacterium]|jgi:hypothetical protein|nr:hypothetical protein [Gammaproteobacteria bacterium]
MNTKTDRKGEGNPDADKRYREAARQSAERIPEEERAAKARSLTREEKNAAREAERQTADRARD